MSCHLVGDLVRHFQAKLNFKVKVAKEFRVSEAGACLLFYLSSPLAFVLLVQKIPGLRPGQDVLTAHELEP